MKKLLLTFLSLLPILYSNPVIAFETEECLIFIQGKNYSIARSVCNDLCDEKDAFGCLAMGYLYEKGFSVRQNFEKSKQYYSDACDYGSSEGCLSLASLYFSGKEFSKDNHEVSMYIKKACSLEPTYNDIEESTDRLHPIENPNKRSTICE